MGWSEWKNLGDEYIGNFAMGNWLYMAVDFPNNDFVKTSASNGTFTLTCNTSGKYKIIVTLGNNDTNNNQSVTVKKGSTTLDTITVNKGQNISKTIEFSI